MSQYHIPGSRVRDGVVTVSNITDVTLERLRTFSMVTGDVLIASYPKTGTTWVEELTWLLCNNGDTEKAKKHSLEERMPFLEFSRHGSKCGLDRVLEAPRPCIMKTHVMAEFFRNQVTEGQVKVIVMIRNPKDTLVSFFHFYRMNGAFGKFTGTWDEFFEFYKVKHIAFGDYFDWYDSWLDLVKLPNVLLVKYEDMKADLTTVLTELSRFLGRPLPGDRVTEVTQHLSFTSMRSNSSTNYSTAKAHDHSISPFMRKGEVGDWKNYFSDEQSSVIDKKYAEKLDSRGVTLKFI